MPPPADIRRWRHAWPRRAALRLFALGAALSAPVARAGSDRLILGTHDAALASALSVAVSPRGLSVMELEDPLTGVSDVEAARREVAARDAVAIVWLCDDAAGAHALCFFARDGRFVAKPISVTSPLAPPDAAALALSVKVLLGAAAPPPPPQALPAPAAQPFAPSAPAEPTAAVVGRSALGLTLSALPVGSISVDGTGPTGAFQGGGDAAVAMAISPFFDYSLGPYVSLGVSPQIVFHVKTSGDPSAATEYDLRARVTLWKGVSPRLVAFARFSPGYSIVSLPDSLASGLQPGATLGTDRGFLLGASAGVEYLVTPTAFLVLDLGYQLGFQRTTLTTSTGQRFELDYGTRYPHVGLGFGLTLGP